MLIFDSTLARGIGVACLFTFIISGVFMVASPENLGREEEA